MGISMIPYRSEKDQPKISSAQICVTFGKFRLLEPTNNLGRRNFDLFTHMGVKFVFKYDISSFRLVNIHYIL